MRPVVSAIIEQVINGETCILLQKRWKPQASPTYLDVWEIPAGGIDDYEDVQTALIREVQEECGLTVREFVDTFRGETQEPRAGDTAFVFRPYICQQVLSTNGGLPWIGFVFICKAEGELRMNQEEARDPQWVSRVELRKMLHEMPEKFFPLQLPALIQYCEEFPV
jgi:8-oxo-dGTP pyrophosphatase MutT (NUDIX family)